MLESRLADTPMDSNVKLDGENSLKFEDKKRCRSLVEKWTYLTIIRLDITFVVCAVSHYIQDLKKIYWEAVYRILRYLKRTIGI